MKPPVQGKECEKNDLCTDASSRINVLRNIRLERKTGIMAKSLSVAKSFIQVARADKRRTDCSKNRP